MTEYAAIQTERKGLSANSLKTIAIVAMIIDHIANVFVPWGNPLSSIMHCVGRITGPTMFYFIVEGYYHTHNVNRYTLRLAIFAAISYVPFIYCLYTAWPNRDNFFHLNVIYTLFLGLLAIRTRHEIKNPIIKWGIIVVILLASYLGDWEYLGILIILAFDFFRGNFKQQAFAYSSLVLYKMIPQAVYPLTAYLYNMNFSMDVVTEMINSTIVQLGMFLPILLLSHYNGEKGHSSKISKWGFYIFYPLHLMVIGLIYRYLN